MIAIEHERKGNTRMVAGKKPKPLDLDTANDILDKMLADDQEPKARTTKTSQLKQLSPKVDALLEKGYTWDEITRALSKAGGVSKDTLRHAVRGKPASKKTGKSKSNPVVPLLVPPGDGEANKVAEKLIGTPAVDDATDYLKRL